MDQTVFERSAIVKKEAEELLSNGKVLEILSKLGKVEVVGSYKYNLMTDKNKDIDIHIVPEKLDKETFYAIGKEFLRFNVKGMKFEDRIIDPGPAYPLGFYWGIALENGWKFDIWYVDQKQEDKDTQIQRQYFSNLNGSEKRVNTES